MPGRAHRVTSRRLLCAVLGALCLLCLPGCDESAIQGDGTEVHVTVQPGGTVEVAGKRTDLSRLPKTLKSAGATRETRIVMHIPDDPDPNLVREITRVLSAGGFYKFILAKPRRAEASLKAK